MNSSWEIKRISEIAEISVRNGISKPKKFHGRGLKVVNMKELFGYDRIGDVEMLRVEHSEREEELNALKKGDLLFGRRSLVYEGAGKCSIVEIINEPTSFESSIIRLRLDSKKVNPEFYYYFFQSDFGKKYLRTIITGAAVFGIRGSDLFKLKVPCPDKNIQDKISGLLLNYDKLIETNVNRIATLEQMTEQLYKEWFVRMRFPNYENTKFTKGIPKGWKVNRLDSIAQINKGKVVTKKTVRKGKVPVVAGGLKPAYYHNESNTKSPTITVSASGANAGYVNIYFEDIWASDCSYIDTKATDYIYFSYLTLKVRQKEVFNLQQGSAQPHVYPKDLQRFELFLPNKEILEKFENLMLPIFQKIENLTIQNINLRKTRDLLLPRLISGKLKVKAEVEKQIEVQKPITAFYQKQILAHIINKQEEHRLPQGEMVLAKNTYLIDKIYGVHTGFNWENWHYGTYDGKIRTLINGRDRFFTKQEVGSNGYKVLVLGENKDKILDKKYHHSTLDTVDKAMEELLSIYAKYPVKERSHKIELLNTTCKAIADTQSVDDEVIYNAFKAWKTPKAKFVTKAQKFNLTETKQCIKFIISKKWDKKLITS